MGSPLSQEWYDANPVLRRGEPRYDASTGRMKVGDGITPWSQLDFSEILPSYLGGPPPPKVGQWQGASNQAGLANVTVVSTSGFGSFCYVDIVDAILIASLGAQVGAAAVGGTAPLLQLALFGDDGSGSYPGPLIDDFGTITPTQTGVLATPVNNIDVIPGRYWLGAKWTFTAVPTTLPAFYCLALAAPPLPGPSLGSNYKGYTTTGLAAGPWTGAAPVGMTAASGNTVLNLGLKRG